MTELHAAVGAVLVGLTVLYMALTAARFVTHRSRRMSERTHRVLIVLILLQVLLGLILFVTGARPSEWLHLIYAPAALITALVAASFVNEAPMAWRAPLQLVAGAAILLLMWRLLATG